MILAFAGGVSDALLTWAAVAIALLACRGWWIERNPRPSPAERSIAEEDARIFYALTALQRPSIFLPVLIGGTLKLLVLFVSALLALSAITPG